MTIGYSTHWPKSMGPEYAGKPNHFPEKIWQSFPDEYTAEVFNDYLEGLEAKGYDFNIDAVDFLPKIHTFRNDPHNRWKVGMKIHPVIKNRTKNRFQFAPELEVKGIQNIEIIYSDEDLCEWYGVEPVIKIDGRVLDYHSGEMEQLALNDGFQSTHQFCHWFSRDFAGKIIHWTNFKY